ncbi:MAG: AAA family ATPase [Deltaproteobacteria bacterium]|jgi:hypothetical protein|nr:AAA family ATPase [Deltaproteobacteria bacterium]
MNRLFKNDLSFRQIRQGNYVYADKTDYIHKILKDDPTSFCFLTRPRRFGKTLLLDTIGELFQGDRELFRGLKIDESNYKFERHPVLKFNMATYTDTYTKDILIGMIKADLKKFSTKHKVSFSSKFYPKMIEELLETLSDSYGSGVVILVDEYDAPVTRNIMNKDIANDNRDVLHDFYGVLKANIKFIRLAFVTGISRFPMAAFDSGANNFTDISLIPKYSGICGFTVKEMNTIFKGRFRRTLNHMISKGLIESDATVRQLKENILEYYDGYNWLGKKNVLNPYSLLRFFKNKKFGSYWPMSGKPSLLSALVRENPLELVRPKLDGYTEDDLDKLEPATVLFHSGYLTIDHTESKDSPVKHPESKDSPVKHPESKDSPVKHPESKDNPVKHPESKDSPVKHPESKDSPVKDKINNDEEFTFKIPNLEVARKFEFTIFSTAFDPKDNFFASFAKKLPSALLKKDSDETVGLLHNLLSAIASEQHDPSEKHYHAIIQAAFIATGIEVIGQTQSSQGKSDMAAFLDNSRIVLEVKYCQTAKSDSKGITQAEKVLARALDKAADQIRSKDYVAPFRVAGKQVIGVAVAVRGRDEVAVRFVEP